jgi:CBS-domain-containing membrane protein
VGISLVGIMNSCVFAGTDLTLVIGSFGASAVLIYGAIRSPLAQPRNLLGRHMLSAIIGVATYQALHDHLWLAAAVAVATAIAVMPVTKTLHPPGGATALIAVIGGESIHAIGYWYVLVPAGLGAAIMLIAALLINNIPKSRRYPEFWF